MSETASETDPEKEAGETGEEDPFSLRAVLVHAFGKVARSVEEGGELRTGIDWFDRIGGLRRGELTVLAGPPSVGKTALAIEIALRLTDPPPEDGKPRPPLGSIPSVEYFSLESARGMIAQRLLVNAAGVELYRLLSGLLTPEDWHRLTQAAAAIVARPIRIVDNAELSITELRTRTLNVSPGALVVVDFVQMMPGLFAAHTRDQQVGEITRGLKVLARERDVAVLALSQMNRAIEARGARYPQLSDLRDSGALANDADAVWFLHRQEQTDDPDRPLAIDLINIKNRNGPIGSATTIFDPRSGRFRRPEDPEP